MPNAARAALVPIASDLVRAPGLWLLGAACLVVCALLGPRYAGFDALFMAAIFLASLASSIAGFAFAAMCGAMLFHLSSDVVAVVQVMITCSIANQAAMTWSLRRDVDWPVLAPYLLGGALGLPIGVWALLHVDQHAFTQALGVFLVLYATVMLVRPAGRVVRQHRMLDAMAGFFSGISGGAVGFPGAFVTIWVGLKGEDKSRQRAVFQPFILIVQVAALAAITLGRPSVPGRLAFAPANLLCVPAGLLGTALGMNLYRRLSNRQFAVAVNILLIVSGIGFLL